MTKLTLLTGLITYVWGRSLLQVKLHTCCRKKHSDECVDQTDVKMMNKEYWAIYMIDFSGPISSGRFGKGDIDFRVLKIIEGTSKEAEKVALSYMTAKTFGRAIKWQKVEDGLTRC